VQLTPGASAFDLQANDVKVSRGATVRGAQTGAPAFPLVTPFDDVPAIACGPNDVAVPTGGDGGVLTPGTYGTLSLASGSRLALAPGAYTFCAVMVGPQAWLTVGGPGTTRIDVAGRIMVTNGARFTPATGVPAPVIRSRGTLLRVSQEATLKAHLIAPPAKVLFGRGATFEGTFRVREVNTDKHTTFGCLAPPN
jgi:hypothetical protein